MFGINVDAVKPYTYDKLKEEMTEYAADFPIISTYELIDWAKNCHTDISIHAYDATYHKIMKHLGGNSRRISLVCFVKDHQCYPITDERFKLINTRANQGGVDNLWKHMSELKWTRRHEQITVLNSLEEEQGLDNDNHVIVLPEDAKIEHAIEQYIGHTTYFVEYLHWDNRGVLDRFLDRKNNEFNARICDTLHKKYKTHEFSWSNQSYAALASSLPKHVRMAT